jgi:hypothetical protein
MDDAVEKGSALNGWMTARSKVWELINSETILAGHSLKNDLDLLRMIHTKVVDSTILTSNAIGKIMVPQFPPGRRCRELLDISIQNPGQKEISA